MIQLAIGILIGLIIGAIYAFNRYDEKLISVNKETKQITDPIDLSTFDYENNYLLI